jgi:hypothetical protein
MRPFFPGRISMSCALVKSNIIQHNLMLGCTSRKYLISINFTFWHTTFKIMCYLYKDTPILALFVFWSDLLFNPFICILFFLYPYHPCDLNVFSSEYAVVVLQRGSYPKALSLWRCNMNDIWSMINAKMKILILEFHTYTHVIYWWNVFFYVIQT